MNPRTFCREPGFPRCLALTFSFDPLFFERIILRDLWYSGAGDITVVSDHGELSEAVARYAGQFNFLGKKYLLTTAFTKGNFHPKLILRVGPKGAMLLIGSGNLTFGGWGGNKELALNLHLKADEPESSAIVNYLLDHIYPYLMTEAARDSLARLRDYPWLINRNVSVDHTLFLSRPEEPLVDQLLSRWSGRRFNRMVVFTGSTDEKGSFINWCQKQFGIEECVVAVSPEHSSFLKQEIEKLQVKVLLAPFKGVHRLHAKFYWFEGPDGPAAIVGSANCSRAAWLLAPVSGGNVECMHVYDSAEGEKFSPVLELLPEERQKIEKTKNPIEKEKDESALQPYQLKELLLKRRQGVIEARFNQPLPMDAIAILVSSEDVTIPLEPKDNSVWLGELPETVSWSERPNFSCVRIELGSKILWTPLQWVDDIDAINRASQTKQIMSSFGGLTRSRKSSEHEKVISDLAIISSSLFTESASYNDPQFKRKKKSDDGHLQAALVKPEDLVKSLSELDIKKPGKNHSIGSDMPLSMFGIMQALFEESEPASDGEIEDEAKISKEDIDEVGEVSEQKIPHKQKKIHHDPPPDNYKKRLRELLATFFDNFSSQTFARECTATKMVQAAAYPLAVSMLGERGHWLSRDESRDYVTKVVDIILNRQRPGSNAYGLLYEVAERYKEKDQYEVFLQVIGDGTLWIALLATLSQLTWEKPFERFERAINLYRVYSCDLLRSDTSVGKLAALVSRIQVEKARVLIANEAPKLALAIEGIEEILNGHYKDLKEKHTTYKKGDLIWNPNVGWGVVKTSTVGAKVYAYLHLRGQDRQVEARNRYINLRIAAKEYPIINELLSIIFGEP